MKNKKEIKEYVDRVLHDDWIDYYSLTEAYLYCRYLDGFDKPTALPTMAFVELDAKTRKMLKISPRYKTAVLFFSGAIYYPELKMLPYTPEEIEEMAWKYAEKRIKDLTRQDK